MIVALATFNPGSTETTSMRVTVAKPPANSLQLAIVNTDGSDTITPPNGWNMCSITDVAASFNVAAQDVYYHYTQPDDPALLTFTASVADYNSVQVFTISNANRYIPVTCQSSVSGSTDNSSSRVLNWNPVTPAYKDSLVLASVTTEHGVNGGQSVSTDPARPFLLETSAEPTYHAVWTYGLSNPALITIAPRAKLDVPDPYAGTLIIVNPLSGPLGPRTATAHGSIALAAIHRAVLGANVENRYYGVDFLQKALPLARLIGLAGARWPGGYYSDVTDWQSGPDGRATEYCNFNRSLSDRSATFDNFMQLFVVPAALSPEITVNYDTGQDTAPWHSTTCTRPGDPALAAAWVAYAKTKYPSYEPKDWEIGNEPWGNERLIDLHPDPGTPSSYVRYEPRFCEDMKAVDSTVNCGIAAENYTTWDPIVLGGAVYDYVDYHYYPIVYPFITDSTTLSAPYLAEAYHQPNGITASLNNLVFEAEQSSHKCEDFMACRAAIPVSVSEWNESGSSGTNQGYTIVGALFAAEVLGEMFNFGVKRAEFYDMSGCYPQPTRRGIPPIRSWQQNASGPSFSNWGLVELLPQPTNFGAPYCNVTQGGPAITLPANAIFPPGRAFQMYSQSGFATDGASAVLVDQPYQDVHIYCSARRSTYVFFLINANESESRQVYLAADGISKGSSWSELQYTTAIYDLTKGTTNWAGPRETSGRSWSFPFEVSLSPWSMTAITFNGITSARDDFPRLRRALRSR